MPNTRTMLQSFAGGEIAPGMFGRTDDAKYQSGAATLRNMVSKPTGPARKRPGFRYVAEVKDSTKKVRVVTFTASNGTDVIVEIGAGYFRFFQDGGAVLLASQPADYKPNKAYVTADWSDANDWFDSGSAHGFTDGDPIIPTTDNGATIAGLDLTGATTYFAIAETANRLQFATTFANAIAHTEIALGAASGAGQFRINYAYVYNDTVYSLGLNWVCLRSPVRPGLASVIPGGDATYWHQLDRNIYEIPNPFAESELPYIGIDSELGVLALSHPDVGNFELRRVAPTHWTFDDIQFGGAIATPAQPTVSATRGATLTLATAVAANPAEFTTSFTHGILPGDGFYAFDMDSTAPGIWVPDGFYQAGTATTGVNVSLMSQADGAAVVASGAIGTYVAGSGRLQIVGLQTLSTHTYKVTAVDADNLESEASVASASTINNLAVPGSYNQVSWTAVTTPVAAARYRIYKEQTGLYGLIGETEALTFRDDNIAPDMGFTPPTHDDTLNGNAARCVAHFEQRRCFAGTDALPDVFYASRPGAHDDFSYHLPLLDDDRIAVQVASRVPCVLMHIVPMAQLVLLSDRAEYRVSPVNSDAITPTSIAIRPQSYIGSSHVKPVVANTTMLFFAARGGHVREMGFRQDVESFVTADVSVRASHLFDELTIIDAAYGKAPLPILWVCSSGGQLLGFTYLPEEEVYGWHRHGCEDGQFFESVTIAIEGDEDRLYAAVKRTVNGSTRRYIEELDPFATTAIEDAFFVDSGLTYDGTASTTIRNLTHLDTETVAVLADGLVVSQKVVARPAEQVCTFNGATDVVTAAAHGIIEGEQVTFRNSGGGLPTGIPSGTILLARDVTTDTLKVEYSSGFGAINFTGNGTGTNYIQGSGRVTLTTAASKAQIGLPFTGELETLPYSQEIDGASGSSRQKNVNRAWVRVEDSGGFRAGPTEALLKPSDPRAEFGGELRSADIEVTLTGDWNDGGQVLVESADPLPLDVTALVLEVAIGD